MTKENKHCKQCGTIMCDHSVSSLTDEFCRDCTLIKIRSYKARHGQLLMGQCSHTDTAVQIRNGCSECKDAVYTMLYDSFCKRCKKYVYVPDGEKICDACKRYLTAVSDLNNAWANHWELWGKCFSIKAVDWDNYNLNDREISIKAGIKTLSADALSEILFTALDSEDYEEIIKRGQEHLIHRPDHSERNSKW